MPQSSNPSYPQLNDIFKQYNELYRSAARHCGLSDCALWILYCLRQTPETTQSRICADIFLPRQTVNSALKNLANKGYMTLHPAGDKKSKRIHLTELGQILARNTVDTLINAENEAFSSFSVDEREEFLRLFTDFVFRLKTWLNSEDKS